MTTMRITKTLTLLFALLIAMPAEAQDPYTTADDTWISLSGTVESVTTDAFMLDYGEGMVTVEMDDWDADADSVLGFVMFSVDTQAFETTVPRGTIQNLYVQPAFRNDGIGSELLDAATVALAERGIDVVKLEVMATNDAARRFYRRHGFEPHRVQLAKRVENDT